jgi:predicted DNA-binding transcriptional regulator YafY
MQLIFGNRHCEALLLTPKQSPSQTRDCFASLAMTDRRIMRADRLLSLLMLLQARGRMTAQELAQELEISERTIYRDINALSASGVPVYAEPGPGGGCALLDRYRTNLTGLTADEARALFMLSIPAPLAQLGVSQELKAALLKLSAALPEARRRDEERIRQRIYLDSLNWFQDAGAVPHLPVIYRAVWDDRLVTITLRVRFAAFVESHIERVIAPYGLVAKAGVWHIIARRDDQLRVYRAADVIEARLLGETFARSAGFDLAKFWQSWCDGVEQDRPRYEVTLRLAPHFVPMAPHYLGAEVRAAIDQATPDRQGRVKIAVTFESLEEARARCLSLGYAVEVLEPEALRVSIIDYAEQIRRVYE